MLQTNTVPPPPPPPPPQKKKKKKTEKNLSKVLNATPQNVPDGSIISYPAYP